MTNTKEMLKIEKLEKIVKRKVVEQSKSRRSYDQKSLGYRKPSIYN